MSPARRRAPSAGDLHRQWLELVDTEGPFLSVPALTRVYPTGISPPGDDALAALKDAKPAFEKAWEHWDRHRDDAALDGYRAARDKWADVVLREILSWSAGYGPWAGSVVRSPDRAVTVSANGALTHGDTIGALVLVVDPVDSLREPLTDGWAASPIDRMEELLRAAQVQIGVVTDGRWWAIVSARAETSVAAGIVDAQTWIEEPHTRNAFIELLSRRRLLGGKAEQRLTEIFRESVAAAEEITEALGTEVRRAVELLVQALSEAAIDARTKNEADPLPTDRSQVYEAAVTVMMRVVFLLFAEERGLLPQGRLFAAGYGISGEFDALDTRLHQEGEQTLDATHLTWHRVLATSQALYRGASFEDLRLPSYGGSLFDPDRFPFVTARRKDGTLALPVSDRVMLEVLRAVQVAKLRGQPPRRISFRDVDVEQIGYIYEGLLGYSCAEVDEITIGLIGKAGEEPEMTLVELEELAGTHPDPAKRADAILNSVKESQPAATPPSKAALAKAIRTNDQVEDADRALRAVTTDPALRDRLRPFVGIVRRDLRDRPSVVQPGGLVVVETPSRATAGAHYTPRDLAEEVVEHALQPLVYDPGPYEQSDKWVRLSSDRLLDLKIADIACGSGAFLVAAARYLAGHLVEAYRDEGVATGSPHELYTKAIRKVVANCLYGADINGMAVEMCKLSLWLVSLDPKLPFSFVDDKVLHGNSLLGLTDVRQLQHQHINPDADRGAMMLSDLDIDGVLARAVRLRKALASEVDDSDPQRSANTKRRQWREYQKLTRTLSTVADGVVAVGLRLGGKPGRALNEAYGNLRIAVGKADLDAGGGDTTMLDAIVDVGLTPTVETDYKRWKPLHWILAVPDVMERGGFDAVVGNPPFITGSDITGAIGKNFRDWLVHNVAFGKRGNADIVAYFFLRAMSLTVNRGTLGLLATNSVAQGNSREIGLDQMESHGFTIMRSIQSRPWTASGATLAYAVVWGFNGHVPLEVPRVSDELPTRKITTLLEPAGRISGTPVKLLSNLGVAFEGCKPNGKGFIVSVEQAAEWIRADALNAEVLFPYLNGEDLNSHPGVTPTRWIIDFTGLSESRAAPFLAPYSQAFATVKRQRERASEGAQRGPWWQFERPRPAMRKALVGLDEVFAMSRHSVTLMPRRVATSNLFGDALVVFATDSMAEFAVLSSSMHQMWAIKYGSGIKADPRYTSTRVFATFPRPVLRADLSELGATLDTERAEVMSRSGLGLTEVYSRVNNPDIEHGEDPNIDRLRKIHVELDEAVMASYGWDDLPLEHGFHFYRQMRRWTVSPAARVEILDRLLEENHARAVSQGDVPSTDEYEVDEEEDE
jgi:hypothetical protein